MIGIDFGTTNSAVAMADEFGCVTTARYPSGDTESETFRSILFFAPPQKGMRRELSAYAGPAAIERYLHSEDGGRLIQSIKSYLANSSLKSTNLFGKSYRFEELVGYLLRSLKAAAGKSGILIGANAVVGRPVRFVGATNQADDAYATKRLTEALAMAGITEVHFEFEPVAAAYSYEANLSKDELLLVADFGGGTTGPHIGTSGTGRTPDERFPEKGFGKRRRRSRRRQFRCKAGPPSGRAFAGTRLTMAAYRKDRDRTELAFCKTRALASPVIPQIERKHGSVALPACPGTR